MVCDFNHQVLSINFCFDGGKFLGKRPKRVGSKNSIRGILR